MKTNRVYVHSFDGDIGEAEAWLSQYPEAHFGIGKKCPPKEVVAVIPVSQLLIESDAPYQLKNPWELETVLEDLAKKVNIPVRWLAELTRRNAKRFFRL